MQALVCALCITRRLQNWDAAVKLVGSGAGGRAAATICYSLVTHTCINIDPAHLLESFWDVMDASEMHTGPAAPNPLMYVGLRLRSDKKKMAKNFTVIPAS